MQREGPPRSRENTIKRRVGRSSRSVGGATVISCAPGTEWRFVPSGALYRVVLSGPPYVALSGQKAPHRGPPKTDPAGSVLGGMFCFFSKHVHVAVVLIRRRPFLLIRPVRVKPFISTESHLDPVVKKPGETLCTWRFPPHSSLNMLNAFQLRTLPQQICWPSRPRTPTPC